MEQSTFHNREPRTREERNIAQCKDALEQAMKQSHGAPSNPVTVAPNTSLYASEEDRFKREVAAAIKLEKEQVMAKKQELYDRKRAEMYEREKARWDHMAAEAQEKESKLKALRDSGKAAQSNKSSEHFNIINMQYHSSADGSRLQHKEETLMYRANMRKEMLHQKGSSVPHNIITGEPRPSPAQIRARAAGQT